MIICLYKRLGWLFCSDRSYAVINDSNNFNSMLQVTPEEKLEGGPSLKLDKRGLPLVPEPSDHIDDPLVS